MQTYTRVFCAVAIALCAAPIAAMAADPRPCELFSPKEVASVLGVTLESVTPEKSVEQDTSINTTMELGCTWHLDRGGDFSVGVIRYGSAADAKRDWLKGLMYFRYGFSPVAEYKRPLAEVPGPSEQNAWKSWSSYGGSTGFIWFARRGQTVLRVKAERVEGMRPESQREAIRDLVALGLKRLP
jgi:hypothetical protein